MDVIDHVSSFTCYRSEIMPDRSLLGKGLTPRACMGDRGSRSAPDPVPRGFLRILSDGDDGWIFLVLKYSIPGFFLGKEMWQVFFGWLRPSPHIYAVFD